VALVVLLEMLVVLFHALMVLAAVAMEHLVVEIIVVVTMAVLVVKQLIKMAKLLPFRQDVVEFMERYHNDNNLSNSKSSRIHNQLGMR
jgi:hypothetical protein